MDTPTPTALDTLHALIAASVDADQHALELREQLREAYERLRSVLPRQRRAKAATPKAATRGRPRGSKAKTQAQAEFSEPDSRE